MLLIIMIIAVGLGVATALTCLSLLNKIDELEEKVKKLETEVSTINIIKD